MGSFPHEFPGYRHVSDDATRAHVRDGLGRAARRRAGPAHPQHVRRRGRRHASRASTSRARTSLQSDPEHAARDRRPGGDGMRRRAGSVPERDGASTRTCSCPARPSWRRTAPSPMPSAASSRVRKVMPPLAGYGGLGSHACMLSNALGYPMNYTHPSRDHGRDRAPDADLRRRQLRQARRARQRSSGRATTTAPEGTPIMHIDDFVRGKGKFMHHRISCRPTSAPAPRFPLILTTGRILSQYNVGAQTRRTANVVWHERGRARDPSASTPRTAASTTATGSRSHSRAGETALRARDHRAHAAGRGLHDLPPPGHAAPTSSPPSISDWATNCPEYKVTAVQVMPSNRPSEWQEEYEELSRQARRIAEPLVAAE